jgi:hypothetical protein
MRQRQRRDSAREWIRSGAAVTVKSYAKRYSVDNYTVDDDLIKLGFALPDSAQLAAGSSWWLGWAGSRTC